MPLPTDGSWLADTWWYGLTARVSQDVFERLAAQRVRDGFNVVQLVAGIPPEVGPEHPSGQSEAGPAWHLDGTINAAYLDVARRRIQHLNEAGLHVLVYGAWGPQIEWIGTDALARWWHALIDALDDLDVSYCLTGESSLWLDAPRRLLPDRSTGDLWRNRLPLRLRTALRHGQRATQSPSRSAAWHARRAAWSTVLRSIRPRTERPIFVHPVPNETGFAAVEMPERLYANTIQTGHSYGRRVQLWRWPLAEAGRGQRCLNLEPWYEGILGHFGAADQLFAYWASALAGTIGFCYGAHGLWNAGDGGFLAHWGSQTMAGALALDTPRLIGASHRVFLEADGAEGRPFCEEESGRLLALGRTSATRTITFYPEARVVQASPEGRYWLPMKATFTEVKPEAGPLVVLR